jgi:hypothetical protein
VALREAGEPERALADLDAAAGFAPTAVLVHYNRGMTLKALNRIDDAVSAFQRSIALAPEFAEAHVALAECLFLRGDAAAAWPEYEWRWRTAGLAPTTRAFTAPRWTGQGDLQGKTILIHAEQGFGDTIQFVRYAPVLAARGAKVVLEAPASLCALLSRLSGVSQVLVRGEPLPAVDAYCPLMSLPPLLGEPASHTTYLAADPARTAYWRKKLDRGASRRVGLAWSGRATHANDANRSIPLAAFAPILKQDAQFIGLQTELRPDDAAAASKVNVRNFGDALTDFAETAALITALDLVATVDTAVAHLAGALGKPVWILLPHAPDWRWGLTGATTHWYPAARLYRQPSRADWRSVIARVADDLRAFAP